MSEQIVPPVNFSSIVGDLVPANSTALAKDLSLLQRIVRADKLAIVATIVNGAVLLAAYFGLKLTGEQVAVIGSIVSGGLGLLLQMHVNITKAP